MKHQTTDLLIRKVDAKLKGALQARARAHGRSLSDEAKALLSAALKRPDQPEKMGTWMFSLLPAEYRGDDLVFEVPDGVSEPPDFR